MRMKTRLFTAFILAGCFTASAQPQQPDGQPPFQSRVSWDIGQALLRSTVDPITGQPIKVGDNLKRFDLTFPGGTPGEFIKAINEQADMKVNVIIPPEYAKEELPPLEVYDVALPQLFEAGIAASTVQTNIVTGHSGPLLRGQRPTPSYTKSEQSMGFRTVDSMPSDNSIWYFFVDRPSSMFAREFEEPQQVQVHQIDEVLRGYSIDDITTAIKTTWGMLDSKTKPDMKFHAETKLLIVRGADDHLRSAQEVVIYLSRSMNSKRQSSESAPAKADPSPSRPL